MALRRRGRFDDSRVIRYRNKQMKALAAPLQALTGLVLVGAGVELGRWSLVAVGGLVFADYLLESLLLKLRMVLGKTR